VAFQKSDCGLLSDLGFRISDFHLAMTALNTILILLAAFLATFWQAAFQGIYRLLGAQIDLLPALIVYASLSSGLLTITLTAVLGGLFLDSLSANPLGVSILPLLAVGLAFYSKRDLILRDQLFAQCVLGFAASAIVPALTVLLIFTKGHSPLLGWGSLWQWTVMSVIGAVATPVWFGLFGLFERALSYSRPTETTFRPDREIRRGRR
jgi:rod shape-determining protein MreD